MSITHSSIIVRKLHGTRQLPFGDLLISSRAESGSRNGQTYLYRVDCCGGAHVHTYKMGCQYVAAAEGIVEYISLIFTSRYTKLQETASVVNRNRCPKRLWFLELALFSVV
jgi:hypothetical protein